MKHLDLFSGIGGFALAAQRTWGDEYENVGHSEIEPYARKVYHRHFPESECLGDITKIKWKKDRADIITGGFPCQPFSLAGKRRKSQDDRFLWPTMFSIIQQVCPRYILAENVSGIDDKTEMVLDRMCADLESIGYEIAPPFEIPACAVNSKQIRNRTWIMAYSGGIRCGPKKKKQIFTGRSTTQLCSWWSVEPTMGRVAYGVPNQLDRGRTLGNAIVPQVAQIILEAIKQFDEERT